MNTAKFFPLTSDWILWPQLRKALKHILISVLSIYLNLSIYLKLSTCLSAALTWNTFSDCSLVLSLFLLMFCPQMLCSFWAWHFLLSPMNWESILKFIIRRFLCSLLMLLVNIITSFFKTEWLSMFLKGGSLCLVIVYSYTQIIYWLTSCN